MSIRIIHLPGMSGRGLLDDGFARGLRQAGFEDVQVIDWPRARYRLLFNLRNRGQHSRAAGELAEQLREHKAREPEAIQILTSHSTGAMVVLDTLSMLDEPIVSQAWLLAAAVHSEFDLRPALAGAGRLVNVYSPRDVLLLGAGTAIFGNADGRRGHSAGRLAFGGPGSDDSRVEQIAYDPQWAGSGNLGGHTSVLVGRFATTVIGPMLLQRIRESQ